MPKTKTKKIDPFLKGFDCGFRKGRNERHEEDVRYGASLCVYGLMYHIVTETQMSYEDVVKLYDGTAFNMRKILQGFIDLDDFKRNITDKYGINMEWDREEN